MKVFFQQHRNGILNRLNRHLRDLYSWDLHEKRLLVDFSL